MQLVVVKSWFLHHPMKCCWNINSSAAETRSSVRLVVETKQGEDQSEEVVE